MCRLHWFLVIIVMCGLDFNCDWIVLDYRKMSDHQSGAGQQQQQQFQFNAPTTATAAAAAAAGSNSNSSPIRIQQQPSNAHANSPSRSQYILSSQVRRTSSFFTLFNYFYFFRQLTTQHYIFIYLSIESRYTRSLTLILF